MAGLKRISGVLSPDALQKSTQKVALMIVHVFRSFFLGSVFVKIYCVSKFGSRKLHCIRIFFLIKTFAPCISLDFPIRGPKASPKKRFSFVFLGDNRKPHLRRHAIHWERDCFQHGKGSDFF